MVAAPPAAEELLQLAEELLQLWDATPSQKPAEVLARIVERLRSAEPMDRYRVVVQAVRRRVEKELQVGVTAEWFHELLRVLPEAWVGWPLLNDPTPEARLAETLLLTAASLGNTGDERLIRVAGTTLLRGDSGQWRLGQLVLPREQERATAPILPILASLLVDGRHPEVRNHAEDLGWDFLLQKAVEESMSCAEIARVALGSPAALLARSPEALRDLGSSDESRLRPADDSPARLLGAAGAQGDPSYPALAVPGKKLAAGRERECSVEELLDRLETSPTAWQWSDALVELLARGPSGKVAGVEIDLRREVAAHVASFLRAERRERRRAPERGFRRQDWLRFEVAALKHGAVLADRTVPESQQVEQRVRAAWLYGDWIGRVLRESPFFGADPELLAARIEAALPSTLPVTEDALWPTQVGTTSGWPAEMDTAARPLCLDELWLMHALICARSLWQPPGPVLDGLRQLARRTLSAAERRAEEHLTAGRDKLEWPGPHLAPPLAARWLLYSHQAEWLTVLGRDAQMETLDWLERWLEAPAKPERGTWIMLALYRDASRIGDLRERSRSLWTKAVDLGKARADVLGEALPAFCLWGATLLPDLPPEASRLLLPLAEQTPARWRVGVLMTLAGTPVPEIARQAQEALLHLIEGEDVSLRLPAAIAMIQLAKKLPSGERDVLLDEAIGRMRADLRAQPSLRVELIRAGRTP